MMDRIFSPRIWEHLLLLQFAVLRRE